MMNISRVRAIALGTLSLFIASSFAHAATLTVPTDRLAKQILLSNKGGMASMRASPGIAPMIKPINDVRKLAFAGAIPKGVPMAPGSSVSHDQLSRFLQLGITQSYNKSYQQGWSILSTNITQARSAFGPLPTGLRLALQSASEASGGQSYETAYKVLHEAMKTIANNPGEFASDPRTSFAAYLRLGRVSTYEKSHKEGYDILVKYLNNLNGQGSDMIPSRELRVALQSCINSSGGLSYQAAWESLEVGTKHMEAVPGGPLATFYMRMAVACSTNKSYEHGYKILAAFVNGALSSGMLQPFERLALETSRTASGGKTYQAAWEILRDGLNSLNQ